MSENNNGEKLQKVLANLGLGSRRVLESKIEDGLVSVNGKKAHLGQRVGPKDKIIFEGKKIQRPTQHNTPNHEVLMLNKPTGVICSRSDPEQRTTIFDDLPKPKSGRWISVGRLDINSEGLILLTTDGELANRLMHPSYEVPRVYAARVRGKIDESTKERLIKGIRLEDGHAKFEDVTYHGGSAQNHWYLVTLKEGRYREVRRLFEAVNMQVARLIRIQYATVELPQELEKGNCMYLDKQQIQMLKSVVGLAQMDDDE